MPKMVTECLVVFIAAITAGHALGRETIHIPESQLEREECISPSFIRAPLWAAPNDGNYGRLRPDLRTAARRADPIATLALAAVYRYAQLMPEFDNPRWGSERLFEVTANAFADLSITGRHSFDQLLELDLPRQDLELWVRDEFMILMADWSEPGYDSETADRAVSSVVQRAYHVAWALRGPVALRENLRPALGWLALSGEDDRPHRPVNVASAPYPQRDVAVSLQGQDMTLRVVFIHPDLGDWEPVVEPSHMARLPAPQPIPTVTGDILIYLHGHASSAEEAWSLVPHIFEKAARQGRNLTILSLDLPGYAYSTSLDTSRFRNLPLDTDPNTYEGLDFIEEALGSLVRALEAQQPGISRRIVGVMGGSLGGNLGLRLASRDIRSVPWARNIIAWSPASVWPSFADDCKSRVDGISECLDPTDFGPVVAAAILTFLGGGDLGSALGVGGIIGLILKFDPEVQRALAVRATHENVLDAFSPGKRNNFYSEDQAQSDAQFAIAGKWYRDGWPCKENYIEAAKWSTGEYF